MHTKYKHEEIMCSNKQKTYDKHASEAGFLLGGIGTGNISVGSRGQLKSWQIFNEPGADNILPYSFFAIRTECGREVKAKILEAEVNAPFSKPEGFLRCELGGLPRFKKSTMTSKYPFVWVDLEDEEMPVDVRMEAFTPFIPLNADDSGIPGAYIRYYVKNKNRKNVKVSVAGSMANAAGFDKYDVWMHMKLEGEPKNEYRVNDACKGLFYSGENIPEHHIGNGNMALATTCGNITVKPLWLQGQWTDGAQDFWDDFVSDGRLETDSEKITGGCEWAEQYDFSYLHFTDAIGSICAEEELKPGEEKVFEFLVSWYFPNRVSDWGDTDRHVKAVLEHTYQTVQNYYASFYSNAWDVIEYLLKEKDRLTRQTLDFTNAFYESTLPGYVLEAVANNITVLRSPTCFRIKDGTFMSWEGVRERVGCGAGTCTHVWNYAQTAAFLFPELERAMRLVEFTVETREDGYMPFRSYQTLGLPAWKMIASADGQLGTIFRLYREWKISGDNQFLEKCYPNMKKALAYSIQTWDLDGDYVLDAPQHVTYDTELYGMNSMVSSVFYAALLAAAEMADAMGEKKLAEEYRINARKGSEKLDEKTFNGEYYVQVMQDVNTFRYQYGDGCLSDQLLGQYLAFEGGLGYILPEDHVKSAIKSVYQYNFMDQASDHPHVQRAFIVNDEKGLTPCTWPKGGRPKIPFIYFGEIWTGIEYEAAALLIRTGLIEEGLSVVKAVRDRQDGVKRNPWSDSESGFYYIRAMSSYALLNALNGFRVDNVKNKMYFSPQINRDHYKSFWCNGKAWGTIAQTKQEDGTYAQKVDVLYGSLDDTEVIFNG